MSHGFYGGIHPFSSKTLTSDRPIKKAFIPKKVVLPLLQHTGSIAEAVVSVGDAVKVGQLIAKSTGFISSPVHASIAGKVTKIGYSPTPTSSRVLSITIEAEGNENQDIKVPDSRDVGAMTREQLLEIIKEAGIVGAGGAAFPTYVKLSPPKTKPIDTVIINGAECEPYLTCDHRLMLEKSSQIFKGLDIILEILGAKNAYIAIEDNKLSAIYAMERELRKIQERSGFFPHKKSEHMIKVVPLSTKYPQGAEKQIVKAVTNRVIPAGGLPMDVGCVVQNVGTVFAIYEAVYIGKPMIERVITITGSCVKEPVNMWVRIGTLLSDLEPSFGGFKKEVKKIIIGGPMMGVSQYTMDVPVTKGASGVLFLSEEELDRSEESVCIRCGKCLEVCAMGLAPTALMQRVKKDSFADAKELGIMNCFECGACAYSCPAKIPLLDYMKFGKSKLLVV